MSIELKNSNIKIEIVSGNITKIKSDAIITAINSGKMWFGGIDGAIQNVAGDIYHSQARKEKLSDLKTVVAVGHNTHHLGEFDNVIFVVDDLKSELRGVIAQGLDAADEMEYQTITFPAIRTGVMLGVIEKSLEQVANEYIMGIKRYITRTTITRNKNPKIRSIIFVIFGNSELEGVLRRALRNEGWL